MPYKKALPAGHSDSRLLSLPPTLLLSLVTQHCDAQSRDALFRSCKLLSIALMQYTSSITHIYELSASDHKHRLPPFLTTSLQSRILPLRLQLRLLTPPGIKTATSKVVTAALKGLGTCPCVSHLTLTFDASNEKDTLTVGCHMPLMAAFPSVTSLTLSGCSLTTTSLARLVASRPQPPTSTWALQSLDMSEVRYKPAPRSAATTADLDSPFCGSCIRHLTLTCPERLDHLPCLVPLLAHLTKLTLWEEHRAQKSLAAYLPAISQLSSLQALQVHIFHAREFARAPDPGYQQLLMAMPNLQSLTLPEYTVMGQRQLDVLLLATQLTHLQVRGFDGLFESRAEAPCRWRHLEFCPKHSEVSVTEVAYLPLAQLTQPLRLPRLLLGLGDSHLLPLALHNLCQRCQAGVEVQGVLVTGALMAFGSELPGAAQALQPNSMAAAATPGAATTSGLGLQPWAGLLGPPSAGLTSILDPLLPQQQQPQQQQAANGGQTLSASSMLAMLQPVARQVRSLTLRSMTSVTTAALTALAAAFPRATSLHLEHCEVVDIAMEWRDLPRIMPAVNHVIIEDVAAGVGLCQSLLGLCQNPPATPLRIEVDVSLSKTLPAIIAFLRQLMPGVGTLAIAIDSYPGQRYYRRQ
ncbi:hypothetical protein V8C86DRAFT_2749178 [Haematococcus lacustris]